MNLQIAFKHKKTKTIFTLEELKTKYGNNEMIIIKKNDEFYSYYAKEIPFSKSWKAILIQLPKKK